MGGVNHNVFSLQSKSKIILLPLNFISWRLKSSTESLTLQKSWFSRSENTMNQNFDFSYRWRNKPWCMWRLSVVVITTAQLHSTKPALSICAGSNPASSVSEIRNGEDLWQCSRLEIKLNTFCRSTIPQNSSQLLSWPSCIWRKVNHLMSNERC